MIPEVFEEEMRKAEFTHRNDATAVLQLQQKIFHQKVSVCEEAMLANLPRGELGQLTKALQHYEKLKVLRLRNIEAGDEEAEDFAKALGLNSTITELKLKVFESARAQGGALWNDEKALALNVSEREIQALDHNETLWKALANAFKANQAITTVNLEGNGIGAEGCKALADALTTNSAIADLNLARNYTGDEGCKALAAALKTNGGITSIDLNWNRIGPLGSQALADAWMVNRTITSINLRSNNVGDEGCEAVADALKTNTTISSINLEMNGIGAEGGKAIAEALKSNDSIASIKPERNKYRRGASQGDRRGSEDAEVHRGLRRSCQGVDATKIHAWTGKVRIKGIASRLKTDSNVTALSFIAGKDWKAIADALKINRAITALDLTGSYIGDEGWKALADALRVNRTIASIFVNRNLSEMRAARN